MNRVIFFQIKKHSDKIIKVIKAAHLHFMKGKNLLFLVDSTKTEEYLDELLWKEPQYSFIPHIKSASVTEEIIAITSKNFNINNASHIFNLTENPLLDMNASLIYEFEDLTDRKKSILSKNKFNSYRKSNFLIESH